MKKVLAILLAISVLALSACAARQTAPDTQDTPAAETTGQPDASEQAGEKNRLRKSSSPHRRQSASSRCQKALIRRR